MEDKKTRIEKNSKKINNQKHKEKQMKQNKRNNISCVSSNNFILL